MEKRSLPDSKHRSSSSSSHATTMQPQQLQRFHSDKLITVLHEFQQTGYLCDTMLVAEDGHVKAHSAVLAASSCLFKASLTPSGKPQQFFIILPGVELYYIKIAVHYCYTGVVAIPPSDVSVNHVDVLAKLSEMGLPVNLTNTTSTNEPKSSSMFSADDTNNPSNLSTADATPSCVKIEDIPAEHDEAPIDTGLAIVTPLSTTVTHGSVPAVLPPNTSATFPRFLLLRTVADSVLAQNDAQVSTNCNTEASQQKCTYSDTQYSAELQQAALNEPIVDCDCGWIIGKILCEYCGRILLTRLRYEEHAATHTNIRPFLCDICGRGFPTKKRCDHHRTGHMTRMCFSCDMCDKSYRTKSGLRDHRLLKHNTAPPGQRKALKLHSCTACDRKFRKINEFRAHIRSHSGEKPVACPLCPRRFAAGQQMRWHMRQHTGEKPYLCQCCGDGFSQPSAYYGHMKKLHGYLKPSLL